MELTRYIEDIERRIDEQQEAAIWQAWRSFAAKETPAGAPFCPPTRTPAPSALNWPHVHVNDALEDVDLMLLSQLERCHHALAGGGRTPLVMRANYGVGIVSSLFGAAPFVMPRSADTLPNVRSLGGDDAMQALLDAPAPYLTAGYGGRVFAMAEKFAALCRQYPRIGRWVHIEIPDCQGPMDNCELLWGSELFCAFYEEPELVHAVLDRITDTMQAFLDRWYQLVPNTAGLVSYFGHMAKGGIVIRDDSAMNLSPSFFSEFIQPYDSRLLAHFGGGTVHFCGRGDHFVSLLANTPRLSAVDISQPHLNDMPKLLTALPDAGICLFAPRGSYAVQGHAQHRIYTY